MVCHSLLQWNWCFQTVVLEKTLESPMERKELKPVNLKGNQPRIFFGRTDAEAEAPILWPPDVNNRLIGRDPDVGKDWRQKKRVTEDEMVEWHHWFNGRELGQAPGDGEGHGSLVCCRLRIIGLDLMTEQQQQLMIADLSRSFENHCGRHLLFFHT